MCRVLKGDGGNGGSVGAQNVSDGGDFGSGSGWKSRGGTTLSSLH